jgi:hypothetical protein
MLNAAVDDGLILANPADKLGRALRLAKNATTRQEEIKAMTREQASSFLAAAQASPVPYVRRYWPLFLLMERTALALKSDDLDLAGHGIRLARAVSGGRIETPMSGHGRTVDMSDEPRARPGTAPARAQDGDDQARLGADARLGVLHGGRHFARR